MARLLYMPIMSLDGYVADEAGSYDWAMPDDEVFTVGGPVLAAEAIQAALVDEIHLIICPVLVGGGKKALPGDVRLRLDLQDERRFGNGVIHLHYRVVS